MGGRGSGRGGRDSRREQAGCGGARPPHLATLLYTASATTTPKPEGPPLPELRLLREDPARRDSAPGAEGLGPRAEVGLWENFPTPRGRSEHTGRLRGRKRRVFEDRGQEPSPSSSPLFRPESPDRAGTVHNPAGTPPPDGHLLVQVPQRGRREALRSGARRHWRGPRRERSPLPGGTQPRPPEPSILTTPTSLPAALLGAQRSVPPAPPGGHAPPGRPWSARVLADPGLGTCSGG